MNVWIVILAAGAGCYLLRLSMIGTDRVRLPARLDSAAALVAPAAFAAIAVTSIATATLTAGVPRAFAPLAAVALGALATARTGSPAAAMLAGMPTYWILEAVIPA
jgi:branched-subunit amino acid transport protein